MNKYIGVKTVSAVPMNSHAAVAAGHKVRHCEDGSANLGYEVTYEDGYKSWSPADVFQKAYIEDNGLSIERRTDVPYHEHEERVLVEHEELVTKLTALRNFIVGEFFKTKVNPFEQERLMNQERVMTAYALILKERIQNF